MPIPLTIRTFVCRALAVVAAGTLAACFETGQQTTALTPAPVVAQPPGPPGAPPAAAPPPAPAPRSSVAGRGQSAPPPPPPAATDEGPPEPYTVQKARGECWMKLENDRKAPKDLERRAVIVEKCAQEKMAAQPRT